MVVEADGRRRMVDIRDLSLYQRAEVCLKESVGVMICGAISDVAHALLVERGINVFPWIRGPVNELVEAYRSGVDLRTAYAMPGCGRGQCARRGQRRRRRGACER